MSEEPNIPDPDEFRSRPLPRQRSPEEVEALLAKMGPKPLSTYEALLGAGAGLWDSDEELDEFLRGIYERRKEPG